MGTPILTSIRTNLIASLAAIDGTAPYATVVKNVRAWNRPPNDIAPGEMPLVGFEEGTEDDELRPFHIMKLWRTTILGLVRGESESDAKARAENLKEDIKYAVMGGENYKRGGYAISSWIEGSRFAEYGDRLQGQVAVDIVVRYQTTRDRE